MTPKKILWLASGIAALGLVACEPNTTSNPQPDSVSIQPPVIEAAEPEVIEPIYENGRSDFEAMNLKSGAVVNDAFAMAPNSKHEADQLILPAGGGVSFRSSDRPVSIGDTYTASVWMWKDSSLPEDEASRVALQLVSWCSQTEAEVKTKDVYLTSEPTRYEVTHSFANAHDCALFQIIGLNNGTTIQAWNAVFSKTN